MKKKLSFSSNNFNSLLQLDFEKKHESCIKTNYKSYLVLTI